MLQNVCWPPAIVYIGTGQHLLNVLWILTAKQAVATKRCTRVTVDTFSVTMCNSNVHIKAESKIYMAIGRCPLA